MKKYPQRISVIGTTGTGKTTLAKKLSKCLDIPHVELDAIHWRENWEPLTKKEFQAQVIKALDREAWVIDGNYSKVRGIIWEKAEMVVWLDYGLCRIYYQLFHRTLRRVLTREELWNNNREHFLSQFFSQDSLFLWAAKSYPKRKKLYPELFAKPEYTHLDKKRFSSPIETEKWIQKLESNRI